jgi:hypothetical protein
VPDELNYDAEVADLKAELQQLQQEFIEAHRASDAASEGSRCALLGLGRMPCASAVAAPPCGLPTPPPLAGSPA